MKDVKAQLEKDSILTFIYIKMSKKKVKTHSTDGLKDLRIHFDGKIKNPLLSKMTPYIFAFGGRIFNTLDERIDCLVLGENPSISKRELSKYPNLKIMEYQTFLDTYFGDNQYV